MPTLRRPRSISSLSSTSSLAPSHSASHVIHPSQDALALLNTLDPLFSTPVRLSRNSFISHRRSLQIRSNYLVILKTDANKSIDTFIHSSHVTLATILPCVPTLKIISSTTLQMPDIFQSHKFIFPSPQSLSTFITFLPVSQVPSPDIWDDMKLQNLPLLGKGATAEVRQMSCDKAVKMIPKLDVFDSHDSLQQIVHERLAFDKLRNNRSCNILKLHQAFQTNTFLCLVTELAHYGDLYNILAQLPHKKIPQHIAKLMFKEIVQALCDVHESGMLYRDMKLANVLVTETGHIRLADFGLSKPVVSNDSHAMVVGRANSFVGTRRYMSPEVCGTPGKERSYGALADVWSLGITLYVMLTGRYPHHASDDDDEKSDSFSLFLSIRNDDVVMPDELDGDVGSLLRGMLTRDALERFDMDDVKNHPWLTESDSVIHHDTNETVLQFLNESGIKGVMDMAKKDNSKGSSPLEQSLVTTGEKDFVRLGDVIDNSVHDSLLGFEFVGQ